MWVIDRFGYKFDCTFFPHITQKFLWNVSKNFAEILQKWVQKFHRNACRNSSRNFAEMIQINKRNWTPAGQTINSGNNARPGLVFFEHGCVGEAAYHYFCHHFFWYHFFVVSAGEGDLNWVPSWCREALASQTVVRFTLILKILACRNVSQTYFFCTINSQVVEQSSIVLIMCSILLILEKNSILLIMGMCSSSSFCSWSISRSNHMHFINETSKVYTMHFIYTYIYNL